MSNIPIAPVRYDSSMEKAEADEAETIHGLQETLQKISRKTYEDGGHGLRSVHAKTHGLLTGELQILDHLTPELAQGLFAQTGTYPLVMRLSTIPGDLLDDKVSTPRGMAIKIMGVSGERLPGSEGDVTQDFVMANGPAFRAPDLKHFLRSLKLVASTTDKAEQMKKAFSAVARGVEKTLEQVGGKSGSLIGLGGHPLTHILGETFYSQVPTLYGPYIAKFSITPSTPELKALTDARVDLDGKPDGLRQAVSDYFARQSGEWLLCAQLCNNLASMPIENASVEWSEDQSPFIPIARISVPVQEAWTPARSLAIDDGMSFSPWHGITAHRPLGSIMRGRKVVYEAMAQVRSSLNNYVIREPTSALEF